MGSKIALYCGSSLELICVVCEDSFSAKCTKDLRKTCDSLCATLVYSKIAPERVKELRDLSTWVKSFKKGYQRKPDRQDFQSYFQVRPNKQQTPYLKKYKGSGLENEVNSFLNNSYPELTVLRHRRPLVTPTGRFELDFYLPELALAIEVQDFLSHSLTSDTELSPWKGYKHGPSYHKEKRDAALSQLSCRVIELWENEIRDGTFKVKLQAIIEAHS